jgi:hypothetical protein
VVPNRGGRAVNGRRLLFSHLDTTSLVIKDVPLEVGLYFRTLNMLQTDAALDEHQLSNLKTVPHSFLYAAIEDEADARRNLLG